MSGELSHDLKRTEMLSNYAGSRKYEKVNDKNPGSDPKKKDFNPILK